ncbi:MAG: DNA topoisomerase III [Chthoniobacterales bacterium]
MSKTLVIAEKPSVAADLARALGKVPKKGEFFENDEYVITSAVGHLVELCLPGEMDKKRGKWSFANLPIIPDHFDLKPIEKSVTRFNLVKRLLKRKDIGNIINACDAGREGELIFRYLLQLAGSKLPTRRLWLQSMTAEAIRKAFDSLRPEAQMDPLADAAVCRSEGDWLVGINSTRAMTAFNSKTGGFQLTPVGRVQTPTLTILTDREQKIRAFKPRTYFEVYADFDVQAGSYRGRWQDEKFKKGEEEDTRAERIWDKKLAEEIVAKCLGKPGVITEEKKPASQASPSLYDLTTLQREANSRFGLSARRTLQLAQALYERHKVLTYPRTDSRYLPEDNLSNVKSIFTKFEDGELASHAQKALSSGWVKPTKKVFNNEKVSDHHAIIPTGVSPKTLDEFEMKIYDMVSRRFIAVFYPPAQFEVTTRITRVEGEYFRSDGKIIVDPGWLSVYGKHAANEGDTTLVPVRSIGKDLEKADTRHVELKENETRPPARYSEATLLSAMEGAGKLIEDEELRDAMGQRGLGTPATRAQIIEGLIYDGYIVRQGRELIATSKGISLITLLRGIGIQSLCSPEMTGEWEYKLKQMEQGDFPRDKFMHEIRDFTRDIVEKAKGFSGDSVEGQFAELDAKCPKCSHRKFKQDYRTYRCESCDLLIWKIMAGREFEPDEIKKLLEIGKIGPLEGFRSKMGRPFAAVVKIGEEFKPVFEFENGENGAAPIDLATAVVIGPCPLCKGGTVYDTGTAYTCSNTVGEKKTCTMRMGKTILQREIPREQVIKLLETGKTDLLPRFISKKGRPFSAYLKLDKGKVAFEFEERKLKTPAAGADAETLPKKAKAPAKPKKAPSTTKQAA